MESLPASSFSVSFVMSRVRVSFSVPPLTVTDLLKGTPVVVMVSAPATALTTMNWTSDSRGGEASNCVPLSVAMR